MLDTEHIVSTVKCEFISKKCYSVDCCFVLGWWVQCHVLCQQWCCACWSWWNTQSYEVCCCTGDTQLGSVNYIFKKFVQLLLLRPFVRDYPGWASSRKVQPILILVKQETVSGSGISWAICKSAPCSRQEVTTPAPRHWVLLQADALPATQPTASKHWRQKNLKKLCKLWEMQVGVFVPLLHKW